jgi:hypothetical protein
MKTTRRNRRLGRDFLAGSIELVLQLPQGNSQTDAVAGSQIAVDDDGRRRRVVPAIPGLQGIVGVIVNFDIRRRQVVQRFAEPGLRVFIHLLRKIAGIEQHEFCVMGAHGLNTCHEFA